MTRVLPFFAALLLLAQTASGQLRSVFDTVSVAPAARPGPHTRASLVAERTSFVPGSTLWVALRLEMDPHWHTYWEHPGDSGMPTEIQWTLPEGFSAGPIHWPAPQRLMVEGLVSYAYEDVVHLMVPVTTPASLAPGSQVRLDARVSWLECKEACVPGKASLSLDLTAATEAAAARPEFEAFRRALPAESTDWQGAWRRADKALTLRLTPPAGATLAEGTLRFFPLDELVWELEPDFTVRRDGNMVEITGALADPAAALPARLRGVLAHESGLTGPGSRLAVNVDLSTALPPVAAPPAAPRSLALVLLLALAGGVLLNLLPCVFPVLGLKISGFIESAHGDPRHAKIHSLVFAAGILVSLWILAAIVASLNIAWGGQLQDPAVVTALLLILTLFTFNLFGVFEMGHVFTRLGGGLTQKQGYAGSFFSGVLITVIATPCTGPFMAGAISWALTQTAWMGFLAFTALGIGIALPYVLLSFSPKLLERMPRPGMWMVTFKQGSAFFMVAFLWVLLWVLSALVSPDRLMRVVAAMFLISLASWILGTWGAPERAAKVRARGQLFTLAILAAATVLAYSHRPPALSLDPDLTARLEAGDLMYESLSPALAEDLLAQGKTLHWQPFSEQKLAALRAAGTPVFIDFTARWCLTCQANKRSALHREEVLRAFAEAGVVTLKADWTARDEDLGRVLAGYGRQGVPTYVFYGPGAAATPRLLPETLVPGILLDAIRAP